MNAPTAVAPAPVTVMYFTSVSVASANQPV